MRTTPWAVAALVAASAVSAGGWDGGPTRGASAGFDFSALARWRGYVPPGAPRLVPQATLKNPEVVVPLPSILDNVRRTSTAFKAGGKTIHVFGDQSDNKGGWFVGFAPDGEEATYRPVKKMIKVAVFGSCAHLEIDRCKYSAHVSANIVHRMQSRLVISADDGSVPENSWTAKQISEATYAAGWPLKFSGREFRVLYSRHFDEDGSGQFSRFNGRRGIVLMFRDGDDFAGYHWYEDELPDSQVLVVTKTASGSDDASLPTLRVGLRKTAAGLELYQP